METIFVTWRVKGGQGRVKDERNCLYPIWPRRTSRRLCVLNPTPKIGFWTPNEIEFWSWDCISAGAQTQFSWRKCVMGLWDYPCEIPVLSERYLIGDGPCSVCIVGNKNVYVLLSRPCSLKRVLSSRRHNHLPVVERTAWAPARISLPPKNWLCRFRCWEDWDSIRLALCISRWR